MLHELHYHMITQEKYSGKLMAVMRGSLRKSVAPCREEMSIIDGPGAGFLYSHHDCGREATSTSSTGRQEYTAVRRPCTKTSERTVDVRRPRYRANVDKKGLMGKPRVLLG